MSLNGIDDAMPTARTSLVQLARERRGHAPLAPWPASDIAGTRDQASDGGADGCAAMDLMRWKR
jgi:hypothetical protein